VADYQFIFAAQSLRPFKEPVGERLQETGQDRPQLLQGISLTHYPFPRLLHEKGFECRSGMRRKPESEASCERREIRPVHAGGLQGHRMTGFHELSGKSDERSNIPFRPPGLHPDFHPRSPRGAFLQRYHCFNSKRMNFCPADRLDSMSGSLDAPC
jgi:hypothetical protein